MLGACSSKPIKSDAEFKGDPAEINAQLGIEYMRKGMYEASSEKLNKAVKQNPRLQLAQVSLAILYEKLGEDDKAGKHYRKAYSINQKDPVTLNAYGQYLCRKGELERADKMFIVAASDPLYQYPELILTNAGICAMDRPDLVLADSYFRKALQRNPNYVPALRQMVRSSFAQQKYLATRAYLQRLQGVAKLEPEFLWIGVQAEAALQDPDAVSSYSLVLKNQYPEANETQALIEWERKLGER
jgi:type IV pilus assembly protein PilF